ncbi:hypothetical protein [Aquisphaera insulae]|uniref:hypothetical protein n=1 Tax=Aquisphaera insulae TaxID=2712864 RepID=UPI0013E9E3CF|nr:hypothetical protein [Aquisphaera insulae]
MKLPNFIRPAFVLSALLLVSAGRVRADVIVNGDFSQATGDPANPFVGWQTTYGDPPTDGGGFAVFTESQTSAFVELEQTIHLTAADAVTGFRFQYKVASSGSATPGTVPDSFQATLYDAMGNPFPVPSNPLLPAFYSKDIGGADYFDTTSVSVTALADGWLQVTLFNLSGLSLPQDVTLEFLLNGFDDGQASIVYLDNVEALTAAIPEPAALVSLVVGLGLVGAFRGRSLGRS